MPCIHDNLTESIPLFLRYMLMTDEPLPAYQRQMGTVQAWYTLHSGL